MYCIFAYLMFFDCESKVCFKDSPANNGTAVVGNEPYLQYIWFNYLFLKQPGFDDARMVEIITQTV